jgi:hypothetical protein
MATTTSNGGTISVPISSIIEAFGGELSEAERTILFQKLIGFRIDEVQPGDLIRAGLFNQMLGDINDLALRVVKLEAGAVEPVGPVIEILDPAGTVEVNGHLTVIGRNFDPEPRRNIVTIGDVEISQFRTDSTPTRLIFAVPDLFTGLPKNLPVRVATSGRTSNAVPITIKEQVKIQQGKFAFLNRVVSPAGIVAVGTRLTISWSVQAQTLLPDNVTLSLLVAQPQGASEQGWRNGLVIHPGSTMPISEGQTKTVSIEVVVPTGATSVQLGLRVVSQDQRVADNSELVTLTVGSAVEESDGRILLVASVPPFGGGDLHPGPVEVGGVSQAGFLLKAGSSGTLTIRVDDTRAPGGPAADFQLSAQFDGPANGIVVGTPNPSSQAGVPSGADFPFNLPLSTQAGAQVNATARLKVSCAQTKTTPPGLAPYKAFSIIHLKIVA